jgi:ACS family pantothenate transporter-like MFS transporter
MADSKEQAISPVVAEARNLRDSDLDSSHDDVGKNAWIKLMTKLRWYPQDMPSIEKRLVLKLDLMILIYGCLCFFTKYLDQASLTNAYVT